MYRVEQFAQESRKRRNIVGILFLGAVAITLCVILLNGQGRAGAQEAYADYSALSGTAPTGLAIVSSEQQAIATTGPAWYVPAAGVSSAEPPQLAAARPQASTIRKINVGVPGALAWIAKSSTGGVCVLASSGKPAPNGHIAIASSCSASEALTHGARIELSGPFTGSSKILLVGVVPNGVSSVSAVLDDGSTETANVSDNAWGLETESGLKSVQANQSNLGD